jgi:hypothetical protein
MDQTAQPIVITLGKVMFKKNVSLSLYHSSHYVMYQYQQTGADS